MISLEDCIAMCGLDAKEIEAIAEHEHIPEISAAALADHLLHQVGGTKRIREMILDDIRIALESGCADHAAELSIGAESLCGAPSRSPSQRPTRRASTYLAER